MLGVKMGLELAYDALCCSVEGRAIRTGPVPPDSALAMVAELLDHANIGAVERVRDVLCNGFEDLQR